MLAAGWIVLSWREPRSALLFALGPLLAPLALLGLMPLAVSRVRAPARRIAQAGVSVLVAALVAGVRGVSIPFTSGPPPLGLGVHGAGDPLDVAGTLWRSLVAHPQLLLESLVFAGVAVALPFARSRGSWGAAAVGAALLAFGVLAAPGVSAIPLVAAAWVTALAAALLAERVA